MLMLLFISIWLLLMLSVVLRVVQILQQPPSPDPRRGFEVTLRTGEARVPREGVRR